jgi:EEF1A N-terminal glycine/lysine methyltransferase
MGTSFARSCPAFLKSLFEFQTRWNAARSFASYLNSHPNLYRDKYVLELGAGGGLPGIVVALGGARMVCMLQYLLMCIEFASRTGVQVVMTDYPDKELIQNLDGNVNRNLDGEGRSNVNVQVHSSVKAQHEKRN